MNRQSPATFSPGIYLFIVLFLSVGALISACAHPEAKKTDLPVDETGMPAEVVENNLQSGLSVIYFHDKFSHIEKMPMGDRIQKYAHPGPPVLKLDHQFGTGKVFDSGRSQAVGMLMTGYFYLQKPGVYMFQSNSNDGFQLFISGNLVIDDPTVHADKLSDPGRFEVRQGGWFPVTLKYFQRKGTATLQLFWQPPGASGFVVVPEAVYYHNQ